jgi:hypothetical protein
VIAALALLYLGVANLVLATPLLKNFAAKSDALRLTYDSAYSVWPGRIEVKNLGVRFEDHNVQFFVGAERGTLDVSLHQLFLRRFHALRVDADNVTYRMRHKLHSVGKEGPRVAAYPPIEGFADPPLFEGQPPPPVADSEYALWNVKVEHVTARVKEIWILEYRYRGPGVAHGTFHVMPERYYDVQNATLDLDGGKLTLADKSVAEIALARIVCNVRGSDPRVLVGLEPLRAVNVRVDGRFNQTDLAFLDTYLGPHAGLSAGGRGDLDIHAGIRGGVVVPETRIVLTSNAGWVGTGSLRVRGPAGWKIEGLNRPGGGLALGLSAKGLVLEREDRAPDGPRIDHLDVHLRTTGDLSRSIEVLSAELDETRVTLPNLAWLDGALRAQSLPELGGRATATLAAKRNGDGSSEGYLDLDTTDMTLGFPDRKTQPFTARLKGKLSTDASAADVEGVATLHVDRASALLPLLSDSAFLRTLQIELLKLDDLVASSTFRLGKHKRFDLLQARTGIARARGYLAADGTGSRGAFLISTPAANVGVRVAQSATSVRLFVADDWLESGSNATARGGLARPDRGRLSR